VSNRGPGDCPVGANVQLPTENYRTAAEVCRFGIAKSGSEESYVSRNEVSVPSYRRLLFGQATNKERSNIARRCRPRPHPRNRRAARVALGTADDPSGVPSGTSGGHSCLSVCLPASISPKPHDHPSPIFDASCQWLGPLLSP